jgi:ribosomal protein S27AE
VRAWSLLTIEDDSRQFAGNTGYRDIPASLYRFDSAVPNAAKLAVGDLVVVRDSARAVGVAWLEKVESREGYKTRQRCPRCGTTALKPRKHLQPRYRCDRGHTFPVARSEQIPVTLYAAHYGPTWWPLRNAIATDDLRMAYYARAAQHAIREVNPAELQKILQSRSVAPPADWWRTGARRARG